MQDKQLAVLPTRTYQHYQTQAASAAARRKAYLGELAIQEVMNEMAREEPAKMGIFLFEDHKIARTSFLLPDNCRKVNARAFLLFLEQKGWLESAADVERRAIQAGRAFSKLRFPPAK